MVTEMVVLILDWLRTLFLQPCRLQAPTTHCHLPHPWESVPQDQVSWDCPPQEEVPSQTRPSPRPCSKTRDRVSRSASASPTSGSRPVTSNWASMWPRHLKRSSQYTAKFSQQEDWSSKIRSIHLVQRIWLIVVRLVEETLELSIKWCSEKLAELWQSKESGNRKLTFFFYYKND